jgi:Family of unknown function (DUF6491)
MEHSRLRHIVIAIAAPAVLLALLPACATSKPAEPSAAEPTTQQRALARYEAYAGPPVDSFTWLGHFDSWEALGKDRLLVYTTPRDAYLLKIAPPCDLRFVISKVGITSANATVYKGLDSIVVNNALAGGPWDCPIQEIRVLDVHRMKADLRNPQPPAQPAHP